MKVEFFIARRHITSSGGAFRKVISGISIGGVTIGVSCLIVALSIENGFHRNFKNRVLTSNPDVVIFRFHKELISDYKALIKRIHKSALGGAKVQSIKPFIYGKGIIRSERNQDGIMIRGVYVRNQEVAPTGIRNLSGELKGIVLGRILANSLSVLRGDTVTLFGIAGSNLSKIRSKKFEVTGTFDAGVYEYNSSLAYLPLSEMQKFLGIGDRVTGLNIELADIYKAPEVSVLINKEIGYPYFATHWIELNTNMFAALRLEKITMVLVLLLITIVACFGISATLIMLITQKTREIGILRAIGSTKSMIKRIFMLEGLLLGAIGTGLGIFLGWLVSLLLSKYKFITLPPGVYLGLDKLPVYMRVSDFIIVGVGAILISFLISLYPATKASKLLPSEAIRYE